MKNKLFSLLFAIVAGTSMLFAESGTCGENLTWDLTDGVLTISGTGAMTDYASSSSNRAPWYNYRRSITSLSLPNGLTTIGEYAFYYTGLTSVTIPSSVTTIGSCAFSGCSDLTSVTIPSSVTTIGSNAFHGCSDLTSVTIPSSVTTIGSNAFNGCSGLTSVHISDLAAWCGISFSNYNANPLYYANHLYLNSEEVTELVIPNGVENISDYAFYCYGLTSVTIPSSVTTIGSNAFNGCSGLTSVTIPNSVTCIGDDAFKGCSDLTSVTIPNSVTSIGFAFYGCYGLTNVEAPAIFFDIRESSWSNYTKILQHVRINAGELNENILLFINRSYKSLQSLDVEEVTNTNLVDEAFKGYYNLETLKLPANLMQINYMAVAECVNLTTITIPESVVEIEQRAFENCRSIMSVEFGENPVLTKIGKWAFYNCHQLENITLPEGVEEIGAAAFYGCAYAQAAHLPASVQTIGNNAFALCSRIAQMDVDAVVPPTVENKTFYEVSTTAPVYVPDESVTNYKAHPIWGKLNIIGKSQAPTSIGQIGSETPATQKILRDGQINILRGDKVYTLQGQQVK